MSSLSHLGGAEISLSDIIKDLNAREEYEMQIVLPQPGDLSKRMSDLPVKVHFLSLKTQPGKLEKLFLFPLRLFLIIKKFHPDIVHLNTKGAIKYLLLSRIFLGFKWIQHIRGNLIKKDAKIFHQMVIGLSDIRIAISKSVRRSYNRKSDRNFHVLYNAFDFSVFSQKLNENGEQIFRKEVGIPHTHRVILSVGRISPIKRQHLLVAAAKELSSEPITFVICGDVVFDNVYERDYDQKLRRIAKPLKNIIFTGWQSELYKYYSIADLLVHTAYTEAFGRVLIEAAYYGVPVIATNRGAMAEIINGWALGGFFSEEPFNLSESIISALRNPPDDAVLQRRKERIMSDFALDNLIQALDELYKN
ncbi:glycosyltransferase family 4 protein [bacterium]|nr:glycosyltransferase family 4 protein [bacterium]